MSISVATGRSYIELLLFRDGITFVPFPLALSFLELTPFSLASHSQLLSFGLGIHFFSSLALTLWYIFFEIVKPHGKERQADLVSLCVLMAVALDQCGPKGKLVLFHHELLTFRIGNLF